MTKIAVIMGGRSYEREVSLVTGKQVADALLSRGYEVVCLDITDSLYNDLLNEKPDCVYIALHGSLGEDGCVQGLLEILELPYVGSGVLASALGMNKAMAKEIFRSHSIPTPSGILLERGQKVPANLAEKLGLPLVVKANSQGSAVGIAIVRHESQLDDAIAEAFTYDEAILVEEYIAGTEVTVGVLGNPPEALPAIEIVPHKDFYDYEAKYQPGMSDHLIPPRLPEKTIKVAQELAVRAHMSLGCRDFSRVDFRVTPQGMPYVLEINTLPGMTPTSLVPDAAKACGISFAELVDRLVQMALSRSMHKGEKAGNNIHQR
ncbi:MAG: D-alanine--D-alanine ligase [Firmicutes bacterium]|jgi:D-alanine-D-alanine ligase|nr:D-alanine--D-alanine ligase [Bacillota bacterium]HOB22088.1 D-alanine--D-alanine ligase [Bacillota bacterium]HQD39931.1 D-alanine--D-alanine ligase [Bacillota bacterium]